MNEANVPLPPSPFIIGLGRIPGITPPVMAAVPDP